MIDFGSGPHPRTFGHPDIPKGRDVRVRCPDCPRGGFALLLDIGLDMSGHVRRSVRNAKKVAFQNYFLEFQ